MFWYWKVNHRLICSIFRALRDKRWHSWLWHYATRRKVAGSIPDGVTGIFHFRNPSDRTMALGPTQRLAEMSTRNIFLSWGGGAGV